MATSPLNQTSRSTKRLIHPAAQGTETPAARSAGLWWLWLVADQATMGTRRRRGDSARSWALAERAREQVES
jgi:hypothetical protein